jgi:hypothetical protein
VKNATALPVSIAGSAAAVAVSDIGLAWSVEHVVWPPAAKPAHMARRKPAIHFRRTAARHRHRAEAPSPVPAKPPQFVSHILTLH